MFSPTIKDWGLYFPSETCSFATRDNIAKAFEAFRCSSKILDFTPEGDCFLGGKIFDDPDLPNGYYNLTDRIESIKRAGEDALGTKMFEATTASGKKYYFSFGTANGSMKRLLRDAKILFQLPQQKRYYNDEHFHQLDDLL